MDSIGETLREARHAKQVSLEDAARATKIKVDILDKLEADDYSGMASPLYTKGFLKLYADYLGLNGQEIADTFLRSQGGLRRHGMQMETAVTAREKGASQFEIPVGAVVAIAGTISLAVLVWWSVRFITTHRSAAHKAPTVAVALPRADFEAYYQPRAKLVPEELDTKAALKH